MTQDYVLITRPKGDTAETAAMVESCGFIPFSEPMLEIVPVVDDLPELSGYRGAVFTSGNAVHVAAFLTDDRSHPLYIVGQRTAEEARAKGWTDIRVVCPTGKALNEWLAGESFKDERPLIHLSGTHVATPIRADGIKIDRLAIYTAEKTATLSDGFLQLFEQGRIGAVLFFSARTAENFVDLLGKYRQVDAASSIKALCIGERVVESVRKIKWRNVQCARTPDQKGMMLLLQNLSGDARKSINADK